MANNFLRLFLAVNPPPEITSWLAVVQRRLKFSLARAGITWARPGQIHVTLKFLGDVPSTTLEGLQVAVARTCAGFTPFELSAEGLGIFPDARKPRVIWAGLRGELEKLNALQLRIEAETCPWREPEARGFRPHLTLGRIRRINTSQAQVLQQKLAELGTESFGRWRVERVDLMQSTLAVDGAVYTNLGGQALV